MEGVKIIPLTVRQDHRGWLAELVRDDDKDDRFGIREDGTFVIPAMCYVSMTKPGERRGSHEHADQYDCFFFVDGEFKLKVWDKKGNEEAYYVGENNPVAVVIAAGIVHGYRNISAKNALVLNMPDRLYAGWNYTKPVDEIRHENIEGSPYQI